MVSVIINNPEWFLRIDIIFAAISILVSLIISLVSLRTWFVVKSLRYLGFAIAFAGLGFSFLTRMIANLIPGPETLFIGYGLHIGCTILALLTLFIVANKIENARVVLLLYLITLPLIFFSDSYFMSFYITTTLITALLALTYLQNALRVKGFNAICVFLAFLLLFLAHLQFLLSGFRGLNMFFISASIIQLLAFLVFLFAIIKVLRS